MFNSRKLAWVVAGAAALLLIAGAGNALAQPKKARAITDNDLGIRKGSLLNEKRVIPARTRYPHAEAGNAGNIPRSFENSPALIPHAIDGMLPITIGNNQCMGCHMPDSAKQAGATPVPRSHLMKLGEGKDLRGSLDHERYNCVECHVRQSASSAPVRNTFRGGFRNSREKTRSDLADTVNEGVSTK